MKNKWILLGLVTTLVVLAASAAMAETETVPNGVSATRYAPGRALDAQAYPSGGAGLVGTAGDYLKFLEAIRNNGGSILMPETAQSMALPSCESDWVDQSSKNGRIEARLVCCCI